MRTIWARRGWFLNVAPNGGLLLLLREVVRSHFAYVSELERAVKAAVDITSSDHHGLLVG
jgi:hypothetical protein